MFHTLKQILVVPDRLLQTLRSKLKIAILCKETDIYTEDIIHAHSAKCM